jgi:hypothetical protein
MTSPGSNSVFVVYLFFLCFAAWKYRKNHVIAVGIVAIGSLAFMLWLVQIGITQNWLFYASSAAFLLASIAMFLLIGFYSVRWAYRKVTPRREEIGNHAKFQERSRP